MNTLLKELRRPEMFEFGYSSARIVAFALELPELNTILEPSEADAGHP